MTRIIDNARPALLFRSLRARYHALGSADHVDVDTKSADNTAKKDSGFTFVELIVSMMIIGVISVVVIPMFVNSISTSDRQNQISQATQQVNQTIEEIRIDAQSLTPVPTCSTVNRAVNEVNGDNVHTIRTTSSAPMEYVVETTLVSCEDLAPGEHGTADITIRAHRDDETLARSAVQMHVRGSGS